MIEAYVKQQIQNNIATIEFFHPEQNSLPGNILAQLAKLMMSVSVTVLLCVRNDMPG